MLASQGVLLPLAATCHGCFCLLPHEYNTRCRAYERNRRAAALLFFKGHLTFKGLNTGLLRQVFFWIFSFSGGTKTNSFK